MSAVLKRVPYNDDSILQINFKLNSLYYFFNTNKYKYIVLNLGLKTTFHVIKHL